jgi:uncharacterized protein YbjT (DUF2867 family)
MNAEGMTFKVIITGATGMVGEGVLLECLAHPAVKRVLIVNRKPYGAKHPKLSECIVPDFLALDGVTRQLTGYDACFYCAGVSSRAMSESEYSHITYDLTIHFAQKLVNLNPRMIFDFVSGSLTDSSGKGSIMWARVKGRAENALTQLGFQKVYNFRPGFMKPAPGQKNVKSYYKVMGWLYPLLRVLLPNQVSTMREVGLAMINSVLKGYHKQVLEIRDIKSLARA